MMRFFNTKKVQILLIVVLTTLAYSNIFQNGLVTDDVDFIVNWESKKSFGNVTEILKGEGPKEHGDLVYRPIRGLLYMIYHQLWGTNTFGYHLHSLLVHLASTILVFLIVEQLIKKWISTDKERISADLRLLPFVTSLLFGTHPIHTEAITFMASSMDMTGVLFMFGSVFLYLKVKTQISTDVKRIMQIGSVVFAGLAFFSYELTLTLPIMLIVTDWVLISADKKLSIVRYVPYFALVLLYFVIRGLVMEVETLELAFFDDGQFNYLQLLTPKILMKYIWLLVWPANLSISHYFSPGIDSFSTVLYTFSKDITRESLFDTQLWIAISTLLCLVLIFWFLRRNRLIIFGVIWFFISLLPIINIFAQPTIMAERYVYIASLGYALISADLILIIADRIGKKGQRGTVYRGYRVFPLLALGIIVLWYGYLTYQRNFDWRDEIRLWEAARDIYPANPLVYYNLGNLNAAKENFDAARGNYLKVIDILPAFYNSYFNLATLYKKTGNWEEAEKMYKIVIASDPTIVEAHLNLANLYYEQGRNDLALSILLEGTKHEDRYLQSSDDKFKEVVSSIYGNIGVLYHLENDLRAALSYYQRAIEINPKNKFAAKGLEQVMEVLDKPRQRRGKLEQ